MITRFKADLGLLSVTVFWGTTFIFSKLVLNEMPLATYLFLRLGIAALALNIYVLRFRKEWNRKVIRHGIFLGILLYLSYFLQMWGITETSASNAGFITGLSVVLVPVFGYLFYKLKTPLPVWISVVLAIIGLLLLSGINPLLWNRGDLRVLLCAIVVAFHIIYTGKFSRMHNVYLLTAVQLTVIALLAFAAFLPAQQNLSGISLKNIGIIVYLALFGTVFTYLMQTSMQRFTTVARTAVIFSMEPVFAALFAYLIAGETLSSQGWTGGILIVLAMIVAEFPWESLKRKV
ncbi:MAG: DMT family transporter [Calditrichaeota bacterium]|nr:DMT family transporter [Calditrichota bacterium]